MSNQNDISFNEKDYIECRETEKFYRCRKRLPSDFNPNTFITIPTKTNGIKLVLGNLLESKQKEKVIQGVLFDRQVYSIRNGKIMAKQKSLF